VDGVGGGRRRKGSDGDKCIGVQRKLLNRVWTALRGKREHSFQRKCRSLNVRHYECPSHSDVKIVGRGPEGARHTEMASFVARGNRFIEDMRGRSLSLIKREDGSGIFDDVFKFC